MREGYIKIKDNVGVILMELPIPATASLQCELQGDSVISLSFEWNEKKVLPYGSFVEYDGNVYSLYEEYKPTSSFGRYRYDLNFYDKSYRFKEAIALFLPVSSVEIGGEVKWSFFGTIYDFANIIKRNIKRFLNEDIEINISQKLLNSGYVSIDFDGATIKEALDKIVETFKSIWFFDSTRNKLSFGVDDLQRTYQITHESVSVQEKGKEGDIFRLFAFGGTVNVPAYYRTDNLPTERITERRLKLPAPLMFIEDKNAKTRREETIVFEDIFPKIESQVEKIKRRVAKRKIEGIDGKISFQSFDLFQVSDNRLKIHSGLILNGETLKVKFITGLLAGLEFDAVCPIGYKPIELSLLVSEKLDGFVNSEILDLTSREIIGNAKKAVLQRGDVFELQEAAVSLNRIANTIQDEDLSLKVKETSILISELQKFSKRELSVEIFGENTTLRDGYVEIQPNNRYGEFLPNNSICPRKGDLYVVTGYDPRFVWNDAIKDAENKLKERAEEWLRENNSQNFPISFNAIETQGLGFYPRLGDSILYSGEFGESIHGDVIKYEQNLCNPKKQSVTIGKYARLGLLDTIGKKAINTSSSINERNSENFAITGTNIFSGLHSIGEEVLFNSEIFRSLKENNSSNPHDDPDAWVKIVPSNLDKLDSIRQEFTGNLTATVNSVFTERKGELKGEKGEDGRSVSIADLGISWQDSQLVIGGVVSPNLKGERGLQGVQGAKGDRGERGEDAPLPNILSGVAWQAGYINENNGKSIGASNTDKHCAEYLPIHPGATLRLTSDYVNGAIGGWSTLFFYDREKAFLSIRRYTNGRNAVELSLKAPGNAYYLRLSKLSSAHVVRLYTLLRGVQISDLTANTEFMQLTARKVSEVGRFVSETALNSALADKVNTVELANYATTEKLAQELSKKQNAGDYVVSSYFSSELSKTNTAVSSVETRAIRPVEAIVVGSSTPNPFAPILGNPNGDPKVLSLNVVEGTDIYLPPAQDCAVGTKIFLRGSTMSCPVTPYHHSTSIRPIRIYSNERDVYSAGRYYTNNTLLETFTNAEWRVDLECIVAGCGLKGWLWTNSVESKNLLELSSSITTAIQSIAETRQDLSNLKNNVIKKGEGIISGFYNLRNSSTGTYTVKATDYHILARTTANGDTYPYIRVDNSLPVGHQFIVDMPFSECRVRFIIPSGATTWGNGGTEWTHGYRYHVTKSWSNEWGIIKTAYAQ